MHYTTLGEGNSTKLIAVGDHVPARTVTSLPHAAAVAAATALERSEYAAAAALHPVAASHRGEPVEARRHLLNVFDHPERIRGGHWENAEQLAVNLHDATAGSHNAARTAIRDEFAGHLDGFDGVLVPATITAYTPKLVTLDLVISGPLTWLGDELWNYMLERDDLASSDDDPPVIISCDLNYPIVMEMYRSGPYGTGYADDSVADMVSNSSDDDPPTLRIETSDLLAWVRHHRPGDIDAVSDLVG